jgi:pilus assembly protein CpaE
MHGKLAIFAVSAKADPELIISAMRCGCTEYLLKPLQPERLADSLQKVGARKQEKAGGQQRAQVVSFVGVKGGSGVTAIAIHLATFLARMGRKTLLIDHHPDLGDAALYLGFSKHRYNFYELINNIHRLDTELLEGFTLRHESGLEMLASAEDFGLTPHVSDQSIQDTIGALKGFYQTIVVDCPPGMSEYNIAAVEQSDRLYLVATPEVPSIRNLVRYLDYLSRCNYPPDKMLVVINRYSKRGGITDQQIEKAIRRRIHLAVPNSYAEVIQAINTGQPVLPNSKSELARVLSRWSSDLTARGTAADSARAEVAGAPQKRGLGILGL